MKQKKKPLSKKEVENLPLEEFTPKISHVRFRDQSLVPDYHNTYKPPRFKREFWPNEKIYKNKMTRGGV